MDILFSFAALLLLLAPILLLICLATLSTRQSGIYRQWRVGQQSRLFRIYKIRTMKGQEDGSAITLPDDPRITKFGRFLRKYDLDELPQLVNVLLGDMSLVGPRPDVPGYADSLVGEDRLVLEVKPGITGPATLKYRREEEMLGRQKDPIAFNDEVLWKDKVRINKEYVANWSLTGDIKILLKTIFP